MQFIQTETKIAAPPERCFLLALNIDLHMESTAQTSERAIAGVTHGIIGQGETVTWRGCHFGFLLTHKTLISQYLRPHHFQDIMLEGIFSSFEHDHYFELEGQGSTVMRDELRFAAPLSPLGLVAETLILRRYLTRLIKERNEVIKKIAESPSAVWQRYVKI